MIYLDNTGSDPFGNLALEEYLMTDDTRDIVMLWQNTPAVIVGRNQFTENQVDRSYAEHHGIAVVRRLSGGGAVYHDKGNLNFTIIARNGTSHKNDFSFFTRPILEVLESYGVDAQFCGRNDLVVEGRKFSGNAQYHHGSALLHHGTILWDSDLTVLARVLKPKKRVVAREVDSHQSRVANLVDFVPPSVTLTRFKADLVSRLIGETSHSTTATVPEVPQALLDKYRSESWNWGTGPEESDDADIESFPASC
ncbi:MAG: lipoate--protein ligase family protein [Actinomycetia bacterium]|nr:lipoate--protein ligase family protein [Actinomycetes bacterium]